MAGLLSIGGVAAAVNRSPGWLRKLERSGVLPPALRMIGSDRRAYRPEDVERIKQILAERAVSSRGHKAAPEKAA